jgi:hypothetical protein
VKKMRKSEKKKPFDDALGLDLAPGFSEAFGNEEIVLAPVQPVSTLDIGGEVDVVAVNHKMPQQKSSKEAKHSK